MKQRIIPYLAGILTSALVLAGFLAGRVSAAPAAAGCFPDTNSHWAETFICWLKDNSISTGYGDGTYKPENGVTRAEMSVFLQKTYNLADASAQSKANTAESNAKIYADSLVNSGYITIKSSPFDWEPAYTTGGTLSVTLFPQYGRSELHADTAGATNTYVMSPTIVSELYSYNTRFSVVELCYNTTAGAAVTALRVKLHEDNSYNPQTLINVTDFSGYGNCPYIYIPTPVAITTHAYLTLELDTLLTNNTDYVDVSTVNFYFFPR